MAAETVQDSPRNPAPGAWRPVHLLYVPTLACNLSCRYCYLGAQTDTTRLKADSERAVGTLRQALAQLEAVGVLAFNVSLHGGEVTTLPPPVLELLFILIRDHYRRHFDALNALGHRKSVPHIKTNLYRFAPLLPLFERYRVSISASIDLPLSRHAQYRTTRHGTGWLPRTLDNLRLLARYPHAKKISATLCAEHLQDIPALIDDIWFIHREIGFDMSQFNLMFAFASAFNADSKGEAILTPASAAQQVALYDALHQAFLGTELEEGLRRHWFDEFTPGYCTNALNCGERFYLLQSDGNVYSCVRGQGIEAFHYGNIHQDSIPDILATGARKISLMHQASGFDPACRQCNQLARCHTGCPVVKYQQAQQSGQVPVRSYTCALQQRLYADNPATYPPDDAAAQLQSAREYAAILHPALLFAAAETGNDDGGTAPPLAPAPLPPAIVLPNDLYQDKNTLQALIAADPILQALYDDQAFVLEIGDERVPLASQLLKSHVTWYTLTAADRLRLHVRRSLFSVNCPEPLRNTLYLQLLRDTPVVYGDEQRTKQEHLFTYQLFYNQLAPSDTLGDDYLMHDLAPLLALHGSLCRRGVRNNLFFTTLYLREYHYQKQKNNAFYHIQAINLPFQNVEFFYLP